jgi:hypothetical protein
LTGDEPGFQFSVTWFEDVWVPRPDTEIVAGEFAALLVTVTLPVAFEVAEGANVKSSVAVCPAVNTWPVETPTAVNPAPERLTFEMVTSEFPLFVSVMPCTLLVPTLTLPKLTFVVLTFKTAPEVGEEDAPVVEFDVLEAPITPVHPIWVRLKDTTTSIGSRRKIFVNAGTRGEVSKRRIALR